MAEYFPLLERAVAALADSTPEARRAIYERARAALLGQLRRMDPPVPEADIARESAALDDAVSRIEATFRQPEGAPKPPTAQSLVTPAPATPRPAPLFASRAVPAARPPGLPSGIAPPVLTPPARERPVLGPRPSGDATPPQPALPRRPAFDPPAGETGGPAVARPQISVRPLNPASRIGLEPRGINPLRQPPSAPDPAAATPQPAPVALDLGVPGPVRAADPTEPEASFSLVPPDATVARRAPEEKRRQGAAFYLGLAVMALLVGAVAYEAWMLRDSPEEVMAAQQSGSLDQDVKVVERASGQEDAPAQTKATDATALPAPVASHDPSATTPSISTPNTAAPAAPEANPATPVVDSATAPVAPTPTPVTAPAPAVSPSPDLSPSPSVGVAERAALLVATPDDPQKVKSYSGSVVWKSESVTSGQGQPLSQAVVADVTIPEAKLTMSMVMQRNMEPQLLASHTIEFRFKTASGGDIGAIKQIDVPQMRLDDSAQTGDPLTGLTVAITDNNFLVGLSRGDAEAANTLMLQKRNWIDLPLLLASGKPAKITFEKGVPGQHVIDEAIKSWKAGG